MRRTPRARPWLRRFLPCLILAVLAGLSAPGAAGANSADRFLMWVPCSQLPDLTDAELDTWKSRGVDGFACITKHMRGMGGTQDFTGDPNASLAGSNYDLQRRLRDSNVIGRMKARGMKAYMGPYLVNYFNTKTPLVDWFDDAGWNSLVLAKIGDLAGAAKQLGFAGIAWDQELYTQTGSVQSASWNWNYSGNGRSEADTRAKVRERGRQVMQTVLDKFPDVEVIAYAVEWPQTWSEVVQREVNGRADVNKDRLDIDFWDGLSSVEGYRALRVLEAIYYKTPHVGTWETAFQYHFNSVYAYLSRRLSRPDLAAGKLHVSPFAWIDAGPSSSAFDDAKSTSYVNQQLAAFRKWGTGGEFADYSWGGLRKFNYDPYADAMRAGSASGSVDSINPSLTAERGPDPADGQVSLKGVAHDNLAIRSVRWSKAAGPSGTAQMTWRTTSGDVRNGHQWVMDWVVPSVPLTEGENRITVTVEDIKGLTTSETIVIDGGGTPDPPPNEEPPPDECG